MSEIGFYHLTRTNLMTALPALLGRTLAAGEKAVIACPDEHFMKMLDDGLWQCQTPDWLPHGTLALPHPEWQPIYLTTGTENPANAHFLFRVGGVDAEPGAYTRVFDLFDGNNEQDVLAARQRWRAAKDAGHNLTYWKQEQTGWVKAG
ncbi:DNA polymerase III subunit chi [Acidocella aminolytica]|jgi:DNA polymerase-3 subunit chi|uniref:DNA polymerase III subunit chi n=1 Tax=Acidocella aminolytica 101 = DSM 11237 TaxID=1120923 RepID=A0A0D6PCX1_9PROT|nr:DNA polymerase III subunit chi [Acidocella aminolytica]GAN78699.1 DNA polymerase III subunit chi [Acidocella aminolytica 101 = DSM 11237]GBQ33924.1 DNA polymerase III subunit chi [Acidocella aminolytica 101 = DSM 11237]SHE36268.1 DNA polymerase III, chi subunit [Acidocella aminolytica 101 = DSM 11237]